MAAAGIGRHLFHDRLAGRRQAPEFCPKVVGAVAAFYQSSRLEAPQNSRSRRPVNADVCCYRGLIHFRSGRERLEQAELHRRDLERGALLQKSRHVNLMQTPNQESRSLMIRGLVE